MPTQLELEFHDAMLDIYKRAKREAHYEARVFIGMVVDKGGLATARYLLDSGKVSDGYAALYERNRLDLTVEALVLDEKWRPLFTATQRKVAITRLRDYGYAAHLPDIASA
jgi:hypothetical protein